MALISLEDLDGLDDDITDSPEPIDVEDEEERERLLNHWQAVASTHQVSVPPEMTGPIQEITRNSQQREPLPFISVSRHELGGGGAVRGAGVSGGSLGVCDASREAVRTKHLVGLHEADAFHLQGEFTRTLLGHDRPGGQ
ncbi:hypothetical protein LDENG_00140530 [Lucifuga dentata]|nr:hypothetical protein LDENG_00140530 [Lucifuga dentata]